MVHNPYLSKGETCVIWHNEKMMWPKYLCINLFLDENNRLYKNTDGFDFFTLIVNEGKLITENHLVFYNNRKDPDLIVQDLSETEEIENENLFYDQVIMLDLNLLKIGQSIKVFCHFHKTPKVDNKSFVRKLFHRNEKERIETEHGEITFHFLDHKFMEWGWPSYGRCVELNLCVELLEITRIDDSSCKVTCIANASDLTKEDMIVRHVDAIKNK